MKKVIEEDGKIFYLSLKYFHRLDEDFIQSMRLIVLEWKWNKCFLAKELNKQAWLYFVKRLSNIYCVPTTEIIDRYKNKEPLPESTIPIQFVEKEVYPDVSFEDMDYAKSKMTERQWEVFYKIIYEKNSQTQTAKDLGCSVRNIRKIVENIKKR